MANSRIGVSNWLCTMAKSSHEGNIKDVINVVHSGGFDLLFQLYTPEEWVLLWAVPIPADVADKLRKEIPI